MTGGVTEARAGARRSAMPAPARPLPSWLRREMPFDRFVLRIHGDDVVFVDSGPRDALAVLLVHGNPTWSFLWRKVIRAIDDRYRVIAPDLVGFGASDKPLRASDHQLVMHVEHVEELVKKLGVRRFVAVGQDWGGPVAAGAASRLADRVAGLVFGNTAVLPPARPFRPKAFHRFSRVPLVSDLVFRGAIFPVPVMRFTQGDRSSIGLYETAVYAWPFLDPRHRAGPLGLARMIPTSETHPSTSVMDAIGRFVQAWRGPAALVWGRRDPLLGRGLRRHREALPQASARETDAGHFLQEEVPELFAEAIDEVARAGG